MSTEQQSVSSQHVSRWRDDAAQRASSMFEAAHGREIEDRARGFRVSIEPRVALTVAVVAAIGVFVAWAVLNGRGDGGVPVAIAPSPTPSSQAAPSAQVGHDGSIVSASLWVHVSGAVNEPGLVELAAGDRVADAIEVAGGTVTDADVDAVNLARQVADGEQIHVPAQGEDNDAEGPVRLNRATVDELQQLPGIGPVLAERIVADRDANGPYASLADLTRVSGVGESLVADLEQVATV